MAFISSRVFFMLTRGADREDRLFGKTCVNVKQLRPSGRYRWHTQIKPKKTYERILAAAEQTVSTDKLFAFSSARYRFCKSSAAIYFWRDRNLRGSRSSRAIGYFRYNVYAKSCRLVEFFINLVLTDCCVDLFSAFSLVLDAFPFNS